MKIQSYTLVEKSRILTEENRIFHCGMPIEEAIEEHDTNIDSYEKLFAVHVENLIIRDTIFVENYIRDFSARDYDENIFGQWRIKA